MLATTWIDVVDDAVKIGLGAAISGMFAWIVARRHTRGDVDKLVLERRTQIITDVAERYEAVFQAYLRFSNRLLGVANVAQQPTVEDEEDFRFAFLAAESTNTTDLRRALHDKIQDAFAAQSRLMLLGEDECRKAAEQFHISVLAADKSFKFDGQTFDLSRYVEVTGAVRDARKKFYSEMSKAFEHTRKA